MLLRIADVASKTEHDSPLVGSGRFAIDPGSGRKQADREYTTVKLLRFLWMPFSWLKKLNL